MTVADSARRQGIGEALTRARIALLEALTTTLYYRAEPDNDATIRLHAKLGFVPAGETTLGEAGERHLVFRLDTSWRPA